MRRRSFSPHSPEPELLTIAQVARRLGRGWEWTFAAAKRGDLPGVEIGGRWYVRNLTAFLEAKQTKPPQQVQEQAQARSRAEECQALRIPVFHRFS